jgi:hypothetical protein
MGMIGTPRDCGSCPTVGIQKLDNIFCFEAMWRMPDLGDLKFELIKKAHETVQLGATLPEKRCFALKT